MIQILLVDDEATALRSVQWLLPWESLGVSRVFSAGSVAYARELLARFHIDLVICDIEMPEMTGIQFVQWLRKAYPAVESIMLTCHADFSFAQEALRVGSLDYILKPVTAQTMRASVEKARAHIEQKRLLEQGRSQWESMVPLHKERFLRDLVGRTVPARPDAVRDAARRLGVEADPAAPCRPVLVDVRRWRESFSAEDTALLEYGICNTAQELIAGSDAGGTALRLSPGRILVVLEHSAGAPAALQGACRELIGVCNRHLCCDVSCGIGRRAPLAALADAAAELQEYPAAHAVPYNTVYLLETPGRAPGAACWEEALERWAGLLARRQLADIADDARRVLAQRQESQMLDVLELQQLQQDFIQQLYLYLRQNNLQANLLFRDKRSHTLMERSLYSVEQFLEWMEWTLRRADEALAGMGQEDVLIREVKDFITLHIDEDISRETVAGAVYLTPDYLSRVFKKKTGSGLSEYIVEKRIHLAQQLLAQTDLPVGSIALQLGYSSFSHFTKLFKAKTGETPASYRQALHK